jgi:VIT1/CCC1 family predicted Fe2+/Mn2+ transporter
MSEEYVIVSFVVFVVAVFLVGFIFSVIKGEINERHEVR